MIIAIHQPNYVPWLGYFHKIANCDKFVFLDDAQYTKNSFINRNRVKTPTGEQWLTIPVRTSGKLGQPISQLSTDLAQRWPEKHLKTLRANYSKAPFFEEVFAHLEPVYLAVTEETSLAHFNISLIQEIAAFTGLTTLIVRSSQLSIVTHSTERLLDIAKALGASEYLSGKGGMNYQDEALFSEHSVCLTYSDFAPAPYTQLWGKFLPGMSVLDALFNLGWDASALWIGPTVTP